MHDCLTFSSCELQKIFAFTIKAGPTVYVNLFSGTAYTPIPHSLLVVLSSHLVFTPLYFVSFAHTIRSVKLHDYHK